MFEYVYDYQNLQKFVNVLFYNQITNKQFAINI